MSASERDWMNPETPVRPQRWSVTKWLIVINVGIFFLGMFWTIPFHVAGRIVSEPAPFVYGYYSISSVWDHHQFWRLITYQFIHAHFGHLAFNMIALYFFGNLMEDVMGRKRYIIFYLLCGIAGALFSSLLASLGLFDRGELLANWRNVPMVGASGAIYGILAAGAFVFPRTKVQLIFPPVILTLRTLAIGLLVLGTVVIFFNWENAGGEAGHIGGMIMGAILMLLPFYKRLGNRRVSVTNDELADILLEKIHRNGMDSLTFEERRFLEDYSRRGRS